MKSKIPILLVTGFLGSGKTTFINWLLENHPQLKISVILNEFGDTPLESQFIKQHTENIIELANGCMCCVAKSDIPRVVTYILEHSPQTEYILIEASGLSDPDPVREALQNPPISDSTYLESTLCIVDAVNFDQMRLQHSLIMSQVGDADLVIHSKVSEAGPELVRKNRQILERLTADVRVLDFDQQLSPAIFLTQNPTSHKQDPAPSHTHHHQHHMYQIFSFETSEFLDVDKVASCISQQPASTIRIKGVITCYNLTGKIARFRIQRVGSHVTVEAAENLSENQDSTILFIGTDLKSDQLEKELHSCELRS